MTYWDVLDPTAPAAIDRPWSPPPTLAGLHGRTIGLRLDRSWRCYEQIVEVWEQRLAADGAQVARMVVDARVGDAGARTSDRFAAWRAGLDAAVVGLGN